MTVLLHPVTPPPPVVDAELAAPGDEVLVVDDDGVFRHVVAERLADHGAFVEEEGSVAGAIAALERRDVDVVLCDLRMPGATGLDLLAYLVGRGFAGRFVLMSSDLPAEAAVAAWARGARCVTKWDLMRAL
jgi:DNA-binding NtrC family response regulator